MPAARNAAAPAALALLLLAAVLPAPARAQPTIVTHMRRSNFALSLASWTAGAGDDPSADGGGTACFALTDAARYGSLTTPVRCPAAINGKQIKLTSAEAKCCSADGAGEIKTFAMTTGPRASCDWPVDSFTWTLDGAPVPSVFTKGKGTKLGSFKLTLPAQSGELCVEIPAGPTGCDSLTAFCGGRPFCGFAASVKSDSNRDCKLSMNVPLKCADGFGRVDAGYDGSCKKCTGTKFQDGTPSIPLPTCSPCQGGQVSTPDGTGCQAP